MDITHQLRNTTSISTFRFYQFLLFATIYDEGVSLFGEEIDDVVELDKLLDLRDRNVELLLVLAVHVLLLRRCFALRRCYRLLLLRVLRYR